MGIYAINGTITAIGQSQFTNDLTIYAYIEITEASGCRVTVEKVVACNEADAALQLGLFGEFFFDRIFLHGQPYRYQLWGLQTDSLAVFDRKNLRVRVTFAHIGFGLLLLPVFGLGLGYLVPGIVQLIVLLCGGADRERRFYGSDPEKAQRLYQERAVRI